MKPKPINTLFIADTHIPYEHPDYLEFVLGVQKEHKCTRIVHVSDEVDQHALSYHEHDPDGRSAGDELKIARVHLRAWYKAFPSMFLCWGNHTALAKRKAHTAGIPGAWLRSIGDVLEAPKSWQWALSWSFDDWMVTHGTGMSGPNAALRLAIKQRRSTIIGHLHTSAGVAYHTNTKDTIWGMGVGAGIDHKAYAFAYAKENPDKPVLGCGVITDGVPQFVPMNT